MPGRGDPAIYQNNYAGFGVVRSSIIFSMMEKIQWKVEGMDCSNCALTIHKFLEKQGGQNVKVNFGNGDVSFDLNGGVTEEKIASGTASSGSARGPSP